MWAIKLQGTRKTRREAFDVRVVSLSERRPCGGGSGFLQVLVGRERMIGQEENKSIRGG